MNGVDFIVDSNILIYILEGKQEVEQFIHYKLGISFISYIELQSFSHLSSKEKLQIQNLLADCSIIESSLTINLIAIELRKKYPRLKTPDAIVAATAINADKYLVTADKAFKKIQELKLIDVTF